jgi:hypothetical protein
MGKRRGVLDSPVTAHGTVPYQAELLAKIPVRSPHDVTCIASHFHRRIAADELLIEAGHNPG